MMITVVAATIAAAPTTVPTSWPLVQPVIEIPVQTMIGPSAARHAIPFRRCTVFLLVDSAIDLASSLFWPGCF
jgi:hypothetical protein